MTAPNWKPLPDWGLDVAQPIPCAHLDRLRSLSALRVLVALRVMDGLYTAAPPGQVSASLTDIRSWSGLSRSGVQRALVEIEKAGLVKISKFDPNDNPKPRTFWLT